MKPHNPSISVFDASLAGREKLEKDFLNALKNKVSTEKPAQLFDRMRTSYR